MRCLFIMTQQPLSPHSRGGGSAIFYDNLCSLHELGNEIHLWHYADPDSRREFDKFVEGDGDIWSQVRSMCRSVNMTTLPGIRGLKNQTRRIIRKRIQRLFSDRPLRHPMLRDPDLRSFALPRLQRLIAEIRPEVIWACHLQPAWLAGLQTDVPVIYSHTDWLYRVLALREGQAEDPAWREDEEEAARRVAKVVSGSMVECRQLQAIGCSSVDYVPVSYAVPPIHLNGQSLDSPRLVHFGDMGTTANQVGLLRFFETVWPGLKSESPDFWAVGDTTHAPPKLAQYLADVQCPGHVTEWTSVLRPYDIQIIPWEHSTGQRTRVPVAFGCGQVVVAVHAGVSGYPEARDGENCRLVERLDQMGAVIKELLNDPGQRGKLGKAARMTFDTHFTRRALLPRYEALMADLKSRGKDEAV